MQIIDVSILAVFFVFVVCGASKYSCLFSATPSVQRVFALLVQLTDQTVKRHVLQTTGKIFMHKYICTKGFGEATWVRKPGQFASLVFGKLTVGAPTSLRCSKGAATQSNASIIDAHQPRVNHALTLGVATQGCVNF